MLKAAKLRELLGDAFHVHSWTPWDRLSAVLSSTQTVHVLVRREKFDAFALMKLTLRYPGTCVRLAILLAIFLPIRYRKPCRFPVRFRRNF